jgi:acyl-CoA thioester hydrolase
MRDLMKQLPDFHFQIHYADVDVTGFVYHSNYITMCERARYEAFRELGVDIAKYVEETHQAFVVKSLEISYNRPAQLGDEVVVKTSVDHIGKTSFTLAQDIYRRDENLTKAKVKIVTINSDSRPVKLPEIMLKAIDI